MLEGQLCYKLTLKKRSGKGKGGELMLLLDYNEDRSLQASAAARPESLKSATTEMDLGTEVESLQGSAAKVYIHTLSPYVGFGGGRYKMAVVKRMTAQPDFLGMAFEDRNCEDELYEDCRTRELIKKCGCVPWEIPRHKVICIFLSKDGNE